MLDIEVTITGQGQAAIEAYAALVQQAYTYTLGVVQRAAQPVVDTMAQALEREPGPVTYPFKWASQKQRRAFFATNGFGGGIPTRRSHALSKGYHLLWIGNTQDAAQLVVQNDMLYWRYVKGFNQQPGHLSTGWSQDATTFAQGAVQMYQIIMTAVTSAWSPENVLKMAGLSQGGRP